MLKSKKHVFWEALLVTVVIFLGGLFLGMLIEAENSNKIYDLYLQSEISLSDTAATSRLMELNDLNCEEAKKSNIEIANRIYEEARLLEIYESSGKLTNSMKLLHKKYDLLRGILWTSNQKTLEKCSNYNLVVYLYEYETEDMDKKVTQRVWSKILQDIKSQSRNFLLIPIAGNQNLTTIDHLMDEYGVEQLPAIVINNEYVIYELANAKPILDLLN